MSSFPGQESQQQQQPVVSHLPGGPSTTGNTCRHFLDRNPSSSSNQRSATFLADSLLRVRHVVFVTDPKYSVSCANSNFLQKNPFACTEFVDYPRSSLSSTCCGGKIFTLPLPFPIFDLYACAAHPIILIQMKSCYPCSFYPVTLEMAFLCLCTNVS